MNDFHSKDRALGLTIAVCPRSQFATKRFFFDPRSGERVHDYNFVKLWQFHPREFAGLSDLAKLLTGLMTQPRMCVLRGAPIIDDPSLWQARQWASDRPTLKPVARQWIALDIDDVLVASPLGRGENLGAAAEFIRDRWLPPEFRGVRCVVTATASTGRKADTVCRCRLWFLLRAPVADADCFRWAQAFRACTDFPLDPSVLQTGQPNYVARPIFHTPLVDPVPDHCRIMILPGCDDQVALNLDRYAERHRAIEREIAGKIKLAGGGWREAAHAAVGGPNSFYVPIVQVIGRAVAQGAMDAEICSAIGKLIEDRADPVRKRQYNTRWLARQVEGIRRRDDKRYGVGGPAWATWSRQISPEQIAVLDAFAREYQQREEPSAEELAKLQAFAVAQLTGGRADV
jgi:hypothetical protein